MRHEETDAVAARYARRAAHDQRYSMLKPDVWQSVHERRAATLRMLARLGWHDLSVKRALEVGCGAGGNLLELLQFGFAAQHLTGIELLPQRLAVARRVLPDLTTLIAGDACEAHVHAATQDLVLASTVFSSLLDDAFRRRLAATMWHWVKPGGGVLWYDFTVNNPRNRDVRGVPLAQVRALFPEGRVSARRITLAPPLARAACRLHPSMYTLLNTLPPLRTHVLAWIEKPA